MEYFVCDIYNRKVENKQILLNRKSKLLNVIENPKLLDYDCQFDNNLMKNFCCGFASFYIKNELEICRIVEQKSSGKQINFIESRSTINSMSNINESYGRPHCNRATCKDLCKVIDSSCKEHIRNCDQYKTTFHVDVRHQTANCDLCQVPNLWPKVLAGADTDEFIQKNSCNIPQNLLNSQTQNSQRPLVIQGNFEQLNNDNMLGFQEIEEFKVGPTPKIDYLYQSLDEQDDLKRCQQNQKKLESPNKDTFLKKRLKRLSEDIVNYDSMDTIESKKKYRVLETNFR